MSIVCITLISYANAEVPQDLTLKKAALEKFLREANNPKSSLGKAIAKINEETSDGRNHSGTIDLPITKKDLQLVVIGNEEITNPWHYGTKNEEETACSAGLNSAKYLVLLSSFTGVHYALEFAVYSFTVEVTRVIHTERVDGAKIEYCEDAGANDTNGEFKNLPSTLTIGEIEEVSIDKTNAALNNEQRE